MFTPEEREALRAALVSAARADPRVVSAALFGSSSTGGEDRWSDVDVAFAVDGNDLDAALADWTDRMYREHGAIHDVDMRRGATIYRVFLLASTLQVDIAFTPAAEFGPTGPKFRLLFGSARESRPAAPDAAHLIGMAWLHALHARSSIARGRAWQAEYMIGGVRNHVLGLACLRHDLPAIEGRGIDRLTPSVTEPLAGALVGSLDPGELKRAFRAANAALLVEIRHVDPALAARLAGPLGELCPSPRRPLR